MSPQPRGPVTLSDDDKKVFSQVRRLPDPEWDQYWERIYLDPRVKSRALNHCLLTYSLNKWDVSGITLAQNRLIILYGPPGTGKTSLARGLANRAATHLAEESGLTTTFIEVDANKLPSQWLGGSQKLVEEAFERVAKLAADGSPVICLLDEVESLMTNRAMTLNESNPVDVYRAVNTVLQQIDALAQRSNVYSIATSNLPKAIDRAFFDRADMSFYVDLPSREVRDQLLTDVFSELSRITGSDIGGPGADGDWNVLLEITEGFSGRQLRKLVVEAITASEDLSRNPGKLRLHHVVETVEMKRLQQERDRLHQGVYQ